MKNFNFRTWLEGFDSKPEVIFGWQVYIDHSACSACNMPKYADPKAGEISEVPGIEKDNHIIRKALAGLQSIGIGKRIKIPITIHYTEEGNEILAASFAGKREEGERTERPAIYIKRPVGANGEDLLHVIPHEVGHVIFGTLDAEDQVRIRELAMSHPHLSDYGNPQARFVYGDPRHWRSGNEWFADVVAKLAQGKLQGEPIRSELVLLIAGHGTPHAGVDYKYPVT